MLTTDPEAQKILSRINTKNIQLVISNSNFRKPMINRKSWKQVRGGVGRRNTIPIEEQGRELRKTSSQ